MHKQHTIELPLKPFFLELFSFEASFHLIGFLKNRYQQAAEKFLEKAIGSSGLPEVTIDKSGANKAGLEAINLQLEIFLYSHPV